MKKSEQLDSIEIKNPCSKDWNRMYGNTQVRFCEHCVKHVHDLSAMTRRKAERFIARSRSKGGSVCVRYIRRPDGKIQTLSDKLYQISGRASRLAAGVFSASLTLASAAYAQKQGEVVGPPKTCEAPINQEKRAVKDTAAEKEIPDAIYGTVMDPNGAVIPGTQITLTDLKNNTPKVISSDGEGHYIFQGVPKGQFKLEFSTPGFLTSRIENIDFDGQTGAKYDTTLDVGAIGGAIVVMTNFENQLVLAVDENNLERVKQLISGGVDVNEKDNNEGMSALHLAAKQGKAEIVELLLGLGAKANLRDEHRRTPLMMIAEDFDPDDVDEPEDAENTGIAESTETAETAEVPIADSVANERVIDRPAPVANPVTAIFNLLISHGAKVSLHDDEGRTALMYAAQNSQAELVKLLISHRAEIDARDENGRTALMDAAEADDMECVKALLEAGARIDLKDEEGDTAYSLCSDGEIEQLLVAHGASAESAEEPDGN